MGIYTLETRRRAASAEGARIEGVSPSPADYIAVMGLGERRELSFLSGVRGGRQRILGIFQGLRSLLVETMHYEVYGIL